MLRKKKIMRWTSWLLTMAMVVTMLPGLSMLASAAEEEQHADVVEWNDTDNDGVIDQGETTYETLNTALNAGGTVKLYKDYNASDERSITVGGNETSETVVVTFDLNGHELNYSDIYFLQLYNTDFTLINSSAESGTISGSVTDAVIYCRSDEASLVIDNNVVITSSESGARSIFFGRGRTADQRWYFPDSYCDFA